ncbi:Uncharacterised protein [Mycobacteroides abscessus subsp. abscessus]|nr:Uncharacterised protein [Mycobacteroides abscessus subsp. abscessus]
MPQCRRSAWEWGAGHRLTRVAYNNWPRARTSDSCRTDQESGSTSPCSVLGCIASSMRKPTILTLPVAVTTTVSGVSCWWNRPLACMGTRASASSRTTQAASVPLNGPDASSVSSECPGTYSETMQAPSPGTATSPPLMASSTRRNRESVAIAERRAASSTWSLRCRSASSRCNITGRDSFWSKARQLWAWLRLTRRSSSR